MSAPKYMLNRNDGKSYYALIENKDGIFNVVVCDSQTKEVCDIIQFITDKTLVESVNSIFDGRFEGIVITVYEVKPEFYPSNHEFCQKLRSELNSLNVPYYFFSTCENAGIRSFMLANINPTPGDYVLRVNVGQQRYALYEYQFTDEGYKQLKCRFIPFVQHESLEVTKAKILDTFKPAIIIGCGALPGISTQKLSKMFKSMNLKLFDLYRDPESPNKLTYEMVQWMKDKSNKKLTILPNTFRCYGLGCAIGDFNVRHEICNDVEQLPLKKTMTVKKPYLPFSILSIGTILDGMQTVHIFKTNSNNHRKEVTIKIDCNRTVSYEVEDVVIPAISGLPNSLDQNVENKIPVIGFFDYSSVICVAKDGKSYDFVKEWGGVYGNELVINFSKEKPEFGSKAIVPFKSSIAHVVFDILKIMSMPPEKIERDPFWRFSITKNAQHPVLIQFKDFNGATKQAPPTMAMAALLKEHLRIIQNEVGERPKEVGFCFFDNFNKDEMDRIKHQLEESCELLKITCTFIKI